MPKDKSFVWKYFEKNSDNSESKCNLCGKTFPITKNTKLAVHTNYSCHLKIFHTEEYQLETERKKREWQGKESFGKKVANFSGRPDGSLEPTLQETPIQNKLWDNDDPRSIEMNKAIGELIAHDIRPFSIVEDVGFRRAFEKAIPNYKMPDRNYFSDITIPEIYDSVRNKIINTLSGSKYISLTSDLWKAETANEDFLSITAHWVTGDFVQKRAVLKVVPFEDTHTEDQVRKLFLAILDEFKLNSNKIHVVVTDNEENMFSGVRSANLKSQPCFVHSIQLCIKDAILSQQPVESAIEACRAISSHFNHIVSAWKKLSIFHMFKGICEHKTVIAEYAADNSNVENLSEDQWSLVEELVSIFEAFENITEECCQEKCPLSIIIPSIISLNYFLTKCKNEGDYCGMGTIIDGLIESVKTRFDPWLVEKDLCIATFLDPRFKLKYQRVNKEKLLKCVEEEIERNSYQDISAFETPANSSSASSPERTLKKNISYMDCVKELDEADDIQLIEATFSTLNTWRSPAFTRTESSQSIEKEINQYASLERIDKEEDPFNWWEKNKTSFPNIASLALRYLSGPPSAVENERPFSKGGNFFEPCQNREKLMFLHFNLRIFDFEF